MDLGPFVKNRIVSAAWWLMPPLIMLTLYIGVETGHSRVESRLAGVRARMDELPKLEAALVRIKETRARFEMVNDEQDSEKLNHLLYELASECNVQLNTLGVSPEKKKGMTYCKVVVGAEASLLDLARYLERLESEGSVQTLESLRLQYIPGAESGRCYTFDVVLRVHAMAPKREGVST